MQLAEGGAAGPAAGPGTAVLLDYVLRRANGYFIYSSVEGVSSQPRDVPVGPVALTLVRASEDGGEDGGEDEGASPRHAIALGRDWRLLGTVLPT